MKMKKNKIYTGWMANIGGMKIRITTQATAPDMALYMVNFKARRAAR